MCLEIEIQIENPNQECDFKGKCPANLKVSAFITSLLSCEDIKELVGIFLLSPELISSEIYRLQSPPLEPYLLPVAVKLFAVAVEGSCRAEWKEAGQCELLMWAIALIGKART